MPNASTDGEAFVADACVAPGAPGCSPTPTSKPAGATPAKPAATKPAQAAAQSAQNTTPQAPPAAQSDAGGDVNMCMSAFSTAQNCCNNPTACMNSSEQAQYAQYQSAMNPQPQSGQGSSLSGTCSAMQSAGQASKNANSLLAGVCNSKQSTCTSVCGQLVAKYQALLNNCSGCSSEGIYQSTVSSLMQKQQQCSQMDAQVSSMSMQAAASMNGGDAGSNCMQAASMNPQMPQGQGANDPNSANDPYGCLKNPSGAACQQCSRAPNLPACQAMAAKASAQQQQPPEQGTSGFSNASAADKNNGFN